jgi:hypothetical protein
MVLSTTKLTASVDSIINQNQGGGPKKAGLPGTTNRPYTFHIALKVHPTRNTLYNVTDPNTGNVVFGLRHTVHPHKALKPVWSTLTPNTYWTIPGTN